MNIVLMRDILAPVLGYPVLQGPVALAPDKYWLGNYVNITFFT